MNNQLLNPADIIVGENRLRQVDPAKVDALVASMSEIGLKTPISVREVKGSNPPKYELVAGHHRLQAVLRLGWKDISAIVMVATNDFKARLWEIDENLCRNDLTPTERAEHVSARKRIYEAEYPDARHGGNHSGNQVANVGDLPKPERFSAATAAATGMSERAVQREAERGDKVIPEARDLIRGTALDTGQYLDKLKGLTPNEQVFAARRDLAERKRQDEQRAQGGIARRFVKASPQQQQPGGLPSFEEFGAALKLLTSLQPQDYREVCPPKHLMRMRSRLAALMQTFEQVLEGITE